MDPVEIREAITLENNGEKIFGIFHRPLLAEKAPAIVICPGFAGNKSGKFRMFVTLSKELAKRGIAVLRFDYRGSGDSEGEFQEITLDGKISDTLKCLEFLSSHPRIDSTRIGLLGRSLGGAIAILTARRYPSIKSLALWAPVFRSDPWRELWESFQSKTTLDEKKKEILRNLPGNIPNLEFMRQFFQLDLQSEMKKLHHIPLLHIHGEKDCVVNIEHAKDFEQARLGVDNTRFIQLPKSDHDFSDFSEQSIAIQETAQWFLQTL